MILHYVNELLELWPYRRPKGRATTCETPSSVLFVVQ